MIKSEIKSVLDKAGVRIISLRKTVGAFNDEVFKVSPHFMDMYNLGLEELLYRLQSELNADVDYDLDKNCILIRQRKTDRTVDK